MSCMLLLMRIHTYLRTSMRYHSSTLPLHAVRLLLECQHVERNIKVNGAGLTFLDILRNLGNSGDWDLDLEQVIKKTRCKEAASMPKTKTLSDFSKTPFTFWERHSTSMKPLKVEHSRISSWSFPGCIHFDNNSHISDWPPASWR
ncbi:unnamed protein product [Brassica oleracea]